MNSINTGEIVLCNVDIVIYKLFMLIFNHMAFHYVQRMFELHNRQLFTISNALGFVTHLMIG